MKRKKKIWIIIKWIIGITIIFILLGIIWNTICKKIDEYKIKEAYGNSVQIDGKSMVVEIAGAEHDGPPIILLPGLGEPSPILEFKPLASELAKKYKVITIEPFGYGLSDGTKRDRTIENIVEELHECVKNLGEEEYYLMGHSISGIYSLYWSQIYPNEIKGIKVCRQAKAIWQEKFDKRKTPQGRDYYWLTGEFVNQDKGDDTDEWALENGYISIVPVHFDLTAHHAMQQLNTWNLNEKN